MRVLRSAPVVRDVDLAARARRAEARCRPATRPCPSRTRPAPAPRPPATSSRFMRRSPSGSTRRPARCRRSATSSLAVEDQAGQRRQRALPAARVVPQPLALQEPPERPDRQLVRHAQRLVARPPRARARCTAPSIRCAISRYGSPHDGRNGLTSFGQLRGYRSAPSPTADALALEHVAGLDQPSSVAMSSRCAVGDRRRGLLRPLQRRRDDVRRCRCPPRTPRRQRLPLPALGQPVARQPAVEDFGRGCAPRRGAAGGRPCASPRPPPPPRGPPRGSAALDHRRTPRRPWPR